MAAKLKPAANAGGPWQLRVLQRAGKRKNRAPGASSLEARPGNAGADDAAETSFLPRFVRTPNGRDWS